MTGDNTLADDLSNYFPVPQHAALTREELEKWLSAEIVYMLQYRMEALLQLLYRIDVNEKDVKGAFAQNDARLIAPKLAHLIIERQLQKIHTRRKYK